MPRTVRLVLRDLHPERTRAFVYKQVQAVVTLFDQNPNSPQRLKPCVPTADEFLKRLMQMIDEKCENPLNDFTFDLALQVQAFLRQELQTSFPKITLHLRDGESYRASLRQAGASEAMIKGSSGIYIGNRFEGEIFVDLEGVRQLVLEGHPQGAMMHLSAILIEEYSHALAPRISDAEMVEQTIALNERFLGFKYTEGQKKAMRDAVAAGPKDGLFTPEFGSQGP